MLGRVASAIGERRRHDRRGRPDLASTTTHTLRDITVDTAGEEHWNAIVAAVGARRGRRGRRHDRPHVPACTSAARSSSATSTPLQDPRRPLDGLHARRRARLHARSHEDPDKAFQYTIKRNTVAVVSDGTAVLGLGDIGPEAAMPVMEGKAMLFKEFAGVDAFPICLDTKDPDEIVAHRQARSPPASAASTSRTSPRRAASRSRSG